MLADGETHPSLTMSPRQYAVPLAPWVAWLKRMPEVATVDQPQLLTFGIQRRTVMMQEEYVMSEWEQAWPAARPRWGTYSVKAHQRLDRIIADLLTSDVLVFPCPDDDVEFDRWQREGWEPELLAHRVTQLGDHAVVTPWDPGLREGWRQNWWGMSAAEREDPEAPFLLTAAMMADLPLVRLMGEEDDRFGSAVMQRPTVASAFAGYEGWPRARHEPLELVAVFQTQRDASALTGIGGRRSTAGPPKYGADADGIRLLMQLETPREADEATLFRTLDLVQDDDFQHARRRLWSWENTMPPDADPREVSAGLRALVEDYNAQVRGQHQATRAAWMFLVVPVVLGAGLHAVVGGLGGVAADLGAVVLLDQVKARFPTLGAGAAKASHHPGSAVAGMLAISGPARLPRP